MQIRNINYSCNVIQSHNFCYFGIDLAHIPDSYAHACFMYTVFEQLKANPHIQDCYIIGLLGYSDEPSKSHYGVFSSIFFKTDFSKLEMDNIVDYT